MFYGIFPYRFAATAVTPPTPPPPAPTGVAYEMLVDGVVVNPLYGWEVVEAINSPTTFRCDILSENGTYRPALDKEIYLYEDGVLLFGGVISQRFERGILDEGWTPIVTAVTAHDFSYVLQWRNDVNEVIPSGTTKAAMQQLLAYAPGLQLDPTQVDGPILNELPYEDAKLADIFMSDLPILSGYDLKISFDKYVKLVPPGTVVAPYNVSTTNSIVDGDITVEPSRTGYANRVIVRANTDGVTLRSIANDAAEQASAGIRSVVITASDGTDQIGVDAIAVAYLARAKQAAKKKIQYTTRVFGLHPGQVQTVTSPKRDLSGSFLITEVRTFRMDGITRRKVTAIEGTTAPSDWRDVYRQWSGGGVKSAGVSSGGGGGSTAVRKRTYLGGNEGLAVRSSGPDWITSSGGPPGTSIVRAQLDTDERGGTDAIVTATMRVFDSGNAIVARLYDCSINAPVAGISPPVTLLTPQTISWNVTLNAGGHVYELNYLPAQANKDIQGSGYVD